MLKTTREYVVAALAGLLGSGVPVVLQNVGLIGSARVTAEPGYVETLQNENTNLRRELNEQAAKMVEYSLRIGDLERTISGGVGDLEESAVWSYIDGLGRPGWCKRVEYGDDGTPAFTMAFINESYELTYGLSAAAYIGRTDFENHSLEAAEHYYTNDLKTLEVKRYSEFMEPVDRANRYGGGRKQFGKFWMMLPVSRIELLCGLQTGVEPASDDVIPSNAGSSQ